MTERAVGFVGLDHHHAEPYLRTLATLPATVTCACEPDPTFDAAAVDPLGDVPVYGDVAELLAAEPLDAVFLTLPSRDAPAAIERAADAGVDVFVEKPAGRTAAELESVLQRVDGVGGAGGPGSADAGGERDATVCVSYPWQSHPIARELESLAADGFFGDVRAFDARFVASQLAFRDRSHFVYDAGASRGGILQWLGVHWLQLLVRLLPDPIERVTANTASRAADVDVEDAVTVQLETAGGALGTLHCGYYLGDGRYDTRFDVYGTGGRSSWDPMGREFGFEGETTLELGDASGDWASTPRRTITHEYDPAPGYGGSWGREFVESFFAACDGGGEPPVTLRDARDVLRVVDAAYESAETGEWVAVERDGN